MSCLLWLLLTIRLHFPPKTPLGPTHFFLSVGIFKKYRLFENFTLIFQTHRWCFYDEE